eukprot:2796198-Rhodomonas_salina.2
MKSNSIQKYSKIQNSILDNADRGTWSVTRVQKVYEYSILYEQGYVSTYVSKLVQYCIYYLKFITVNSSRYRGITASGGFTLCIAYAGSAEFYTARATKWKYLR